MIHFSKWKILLTIAVCVFALVFSAPNFIPESKKNSALFKFFPNNKVSLGLDLRGGSHLLLQIDSDFYLKEQLSNIKEEIKKQFREEQIRSIPVIENGKIIARFSDENDLKKAKKTIKKISKEVSIDEEGSSLELFFSDQQLTQIHQNLIAQSIEIVRRRVDETGTKEPIIQAQGQDRILLQVPGIDNPEEIKNILGKTAKMTFHFVVDEALGNPDLVDGLSRLGVEKMMDNQGRIYLIKSPVILSGDLLTDANPTYHEGQPAVGFRFNDLGTKKFAEITKDNIGRVFAIVLDGKVITAPRINSAITQGSGVISGSFTVKEARDVALLLRAGALPAPLTVIEERTVGPSLGSDSIRSGAIASVGGLILVSLFMVMFYRSFGMIANVALVINIALILTFLSLIEATLTLPGIAGIVLVMGMSVDANVLIFERMKEERKNNKSVMATVDAGFSQAFRTITDSNITTLIVALFLYIFGNGPVRGFSVTLSIGIISSMFSAIMLTRLIIVSWVRFKKPHSLPI
jgi:preprotein translocase subunit SecD